MRTHQENQDMNPRRNALSARGPLLVAVAAVLVLTGCGSSGESAVATSTTAAAPAQQWNPGESPTTSPAAPTSPRPPAASLPPEAAGVDFTSPDAVARAALTVWFGWNTNTDTGPNDAAQRSTPLLTDRFADSITATSAVSGPGGQWLEWAAERAVVAVEVDPSTASVPEETPTEAYRVFEITQTARTPDGEVVGTRKVGANVQLRNASGDRWEVEKISER
ncbi:hypothetical protein CH276_02555 [Rhodococcus sp. 06-470-2]|uniref:hypothetical protein n=1 Tax=unclassified Rhodococcus (in: high G+C Gram-positive bacteria) TaxID=192944 RepID=UPI000B9BFA3B|nr:MULTISPECIES: hypothetical protein [unclassified Rhodococcus (in: high G+C Gram-positive bacteria)]KAA0922058.1 hypothetical protein FQ188_22350 [Rhodococcus sp. ANT_H53B]OZC69767.1 hypothetical protein CH276_02555 [Rhodococcus sp. 06-470-2]OZE64965.1 hypothetical protein CH265_09925 [Rhodococcus sp. 05-2221-1B]